MKYFLYTYIKSIYAPARARTVDRTIPVYFFNSRVLYQLSYKNIIVVNLLLHK